MASSSVSAPDPATSAQGSSSVDIVEFSSVPRGRGSDEDRARWAKFINSTPLTEHNVGSERNPSARESHSREGSPLRTFSSAEVDEPPARLQPWLDPNEVEPRFALTDDLQAAIDDLHSKGVEEVIPEQLLMGHFKALFEEGNFNTIEDVKAAYERVYGSDECDLSTEFVYELTLNLLKSTDPFGAVARDLASKQHATLEEERKLHSESMKQYQRQLGEQFAKDLADMSNSMNDILACKVQEFNSLKVSHRQATKHCSRCPRSTACHVDH
jgi:hypothetical protein